MKTSIPPQPPALRSHHPNAHRTLRHLLCVLLPFLLLAAAPLSAQTVLTWDPAATQAGTQIYTHPNTNAGDYTFSVVVPAGSAAGMRFRLHVSAGNADLYVKQGSVPTTGSYGFASTLAGSDPIALNPSQYSAGQTWYILVKAFAGASWTLLAGDAAVALPWDPGTTDAGSLAYAHPDTAPGDYWFRLTTQSTATGGWRTALKVNSGEAHVYLKLGSLPTPASFDYKSERTGSDGWVLRPDQFSAGQQWFVLVRVIGAASWTLCSGEVFVQNLGPLQWNDNGNGVFDIGETALPSGSGNVSIGPEAMRFFKAIVNTLAKTAGASSAGPVADSFSPAPARASTYDNIAATGAVTLAGSLQLKLPQRLRERHRQLPQLHHPLRREHHRHLDQPAEQLAHHPPERSRIAENRLLLHAQSSTLFAMTTAAKTFRQPGGRASIARKKAAVEQFWIRPGNRELDRTGDFILKNLPGIRKEAASRAGAA